MRSGGPGPDGPGKVLLPWEFEFPESSERCTRKDAVTGRTQVTVYLTSMGDYCIQYSLTNNIAGRVTFYTATLESGQIWADTKMKEAGYRLASQRTQSFK